MHENTLIMPCVPYCRIVTVRQKLSVRHLCGGLCMVVEKLINLGGRKVFVKIIGEGAPIVFLHGGPGSEHNFFLPHVMPLSQNFKLVLYDQTGCGK